MEHVLPITLRAVVVNSESRYPSIYIVNKSCFKHSFHIKADNSGARIWLRYCQIDFVSPVNVASYITVILFLSHDS